jgi:hypothetical protein
MYVCMHLSTYLLSSIHFSIHPSINPSSHPSFYTCTTHSTIKVMHCREVDPHEIALNCANEVTFLLFCLFHCQGITNYCYPHFNRFLPFLICNYFQNAALSCTTMVLKEEQTLSLRIPIICFLLIRQINFKNWYV